jgi:uncharacterized Zn-binding protein involved in type VI secretion
MSAIDTAQQAARLHDPVEHGLGLVGMLGGALLGLAAGLLLVVGGVVTGGALIAVVVAGCIAGGGLAGGQLMRGIQQAAELDSPSGAIAIGSQNVRIGGLSAARAGLDYVADCNGFLLNHVTVQGVHIAEGSGTVRINGKPAARVSSRLTCGAKIIRGKENVYIGGATEQVLSVYSAEGIYENILKILGLPGLILGGVAAPGAFIAAIAGFELLGLTGDRIGPGWRDVLQGAGGLLTLGVAGRRGWNQARSRTTPQERQSNQGLETKGYRPQPGERSTTREQWQAQQSRIRADNTVSKADQALRPSPNGPRHGHGHADHGYQTTDAQQAQRVATGQTPSGRTLANGNIPDPPTRASRFSSPEAEAESLGRARRKLNDDLANGAVGSYIDQVTGKPTYVNPANGMPVRHSTEVTTNRPNGFGDTFYTPQQGPNGAYLTDQYGNRIPQLNNTPMTKGFTRWEYVPSTGQWQPVTYYPK